MCCAIVVKSKSDAGKRAAPNKRRAASGASAVPTRPTAALKEAVNATKQMPAWSWCVRTPAHNLHARPNAICGTRVYVGCRRQRATSNEGCDKPSACSESVDWRTRFIKATNALPGVAGPRGRKGTRGDRAQPSVRQGLAES